MIRPRESREEVRRLWTSTMDEAARRGRSRAPRAGLECRSSHGPWSATESGSGLGADLDAQVAAVDELHHQERADLGHVGVEGHDDVRVAELRDSLDLALEPPGERVTPGCLAVEDLESDGPLHPAMAGLVDRPHAPSAEVLEDDVVADADLLEPSSPDGIGLEGGQVAEVDQAAGEGVAVGDVGLVSQPPEERAQRGLVEQAAVVKVLLEFLARDGTGHPHPPSASPPAGRTRRVKSPTSLAKSTIRNSRRRARPEHDGVLRAG